MILEKISYTWGKGGVDFRVRGLCSVLVSMTLRPLSGDELKLQAQSLASPGARKGHAMNTGKLFVVVIRLLGISLSSPPPSTIKTAL